MKLRVWNAINIGSGRMYKKEVKSVYEAKKVIDVLIDFELFLEDEIQSNSFGLEEFDENDQQWYEWCDDDGLQMSDLI